MVVLLESLGAAGGDDRNRHVPAFFERDADGLPTRWVEMMCRPGWVNCAARVSQEALATLYPESAALFDRRP